MFINKTGSSDIVDSIDDYDVFNSSAIFLMDQHPKSSRVIGKYAGRLDLLTEAIYKTTLNYGLLGLINRISNNKLSLGSYIKYIDESDVMSIYS